MTNDAVELERIEERLAAASPRKSKRTSMILNGSIGVLYIALGLSRVFASGGRGSGPGYYWLALGLVYVLLFALAYRASRKPARRETATMTETDVTVSDTGLRFTPSARTLPWTKIAGVRNVDGYLVFVAPSGASQAAIAKSDLARDGHDLWFALDDLFVSKRYLVRARMPTEWMAVNPYATARPSGGGSSVKTSPDATLG